jgi:hypothetical protein
MLPPKSKLKTVPAKLVAAFDAAGKEESGVVVVAGFISSQEDWAAFDAAWRDRLKHDGLDYFHMVDFAGSRKQFADGWKNNEKRRQSLFADLIGIIKGHVYRQFASAIEMRTLDKLSGANKKEYALNAYVLAARSCAADVRIWQEKEHFQPATAYVFEDGDDGKGKMTERFLNDNLPIPHFKAKKDGVKDDGTEIKAYTPLQAADILCYELLKGHRGILSGKRVRRFRYGFRELSKIPGEPGYYSSENMVELNRKLHELSALGYVEDPPGQIAQPR